ncbi:MAG: HpcH/HpaI aldolase/citrate lyase family protein [Aquiluna sp.]
MSFQVKLDTTFAAKLKAAKRVLAGVWVCSGNPVVAEICAGSGLDWLLIDAEHTANDLQSLQMQLQAVQGYGATPVVRPPHSAPALILPMVNSADEAREHVRAISYPPHGIRGVGSALARASRWNRVENYLQDAQDSISLFVQIETIEAIQNLNEILDVEGIDGIFIGPSDLAASMGLLGQQEHPDVVTHVLNTIAAAKQKGLYAGVNAFAPSTAEKYAAAGVDFILVNADVAILARATEGIAKQYGAGEAANNRSSY